MNKIAKIIGFVALTSVSGLAFAGEGCHSKRGMHAQGEQNKAHHCMTSSHGYTKQGHENRGHKMCASGHQKGMQGNRVAMSPEKRQAFMQLKVENRIERMTQRLDLTADQQSQVRGILKERQQKMQQIGKASRAQIEKVLTDEQRQKMQK